MEYFTKISIYENNIHLLLMVVKVYMAKHAR